jgi:hypothetical protein
VHPEQGAEFFREGLIFQVADESHTSGGAVRRWGRLASGRGFQQPRRRFRLGMAGRLTDVVSAWLERVAGASLGLPRALPHREKCVNGKRRGSVLRRVKQV